MKEKRKRRPEYGKKQIMGGLKSATAKTAKRKAGFLQVRKGNGGKGRNRQKTVASNSLAKTYQEGGGLAMKLEKRKKGKKGRGRMYPV